MGNDYEILQIIKHFIIIVSTYYISAKIMNERNAEAKNIIILLINIINTIIFCFFKQQIGLVPATISIIILIAFLIWKISKQNIAKIMVCTLISLTINNILYIFASAVIYVPSKLLSINNIYVLNFIINIVYILFVYVFFKMRKIKNGFDFLNTNLDNVYFEILFFNISVIILFTIIILINSKEISTSKTVFYLFIVAFIMFTTIQKSLQLYYKQKLLIKELEETKEELASKEKEITELEMENIKISKKSHTLVHKQKALEYKIEEIIKKSEISNEEAEEVKERIKSLEKELYKEKTTIKLDKTEIPQIDNMLEFMQSECTKNKIDFELQIKGNIHYMVDNLISQDDLETLLADHIKNAIIAINHSDNINRSILVKLGKIDGIYSLYIYDSGIEFEKDTLNNLGKKPSTTHKQEGGTGMGFMNTFDTLRKCNASLIIEEIGQLSKDNYTKSIIIKFNKKNEFKVISYSKKDSIL